MAMATDTHKKLVDLVKTKQPTPILLTDDIDDAFVPGFQSFVAELIQNATGVYSYSEHGGCTNWRLGVIALHEKRVLEDIIVKLPESYRAQGGKSGEIKLRK